jgi:hypothetical protein
MKGIITEADWNELKDTIQYKYATDAFYTESKEQQILQSRIEILNGMATYIGTLYSKEYVQKHILKLSDEDIAEIELQNKADPVDLEPAMQPPPDEGQNNGQQ